MVLGESDQTRVKSLEAVGMIQSCEIKADTSYGSVNIRINKAKITVDRRQADGKVTILVRAPEPREHKTEMATIKAWLGPAKILELDIPANHHGLKIEVTGEKSAIMYLAGVKVCFMPLYHIELTVKLLNCFPSVCCFAKHHRSGNAK